MTQSFYRWGAGARLQWPGRGPAGRTAGREQSDYMGECVLLCRYLPETCAHLEELEHLAAGMANILVLHGPNLNMLGQREPEHYGSAGLDAIDARLADLAAAEGHQLQSFQSNAEHLLVERVQAACGEAVDFIIVNPAAFTHTSIALRDAFLASGIPFIEVHLSNIHRREVFRQHSYFSDVAVGVIAGLGPQGYELAFRAAVEQLGNNDD